MDPTAQRIESIKAFVSSLKTVFAN